jgi:hypothetical protein
MMRKIMPIITQPSVPKENLSEMSGEMAPVGSRASFEDTAVTP